MIHSNTGYITEEPIIEEKLKSTLISPAFPIFETYTKPKFLDCISVDTLTEDIGDITIYMFDKNYLPVEVQSI